MKSKLLVIHCAESGKRALDRMTQIGYRLPEDIRILEMPCLGMISDVMLMEALQNGVDGIMAIGCRKDNCKHLDGNLRAEKRVARVRKLLREAEISNKSVEIFCIAPDEGKRLYEKLHSFHETPIQKNRAKEQG